MPSALLLFALGLSSAIASLPDSCLWCVYSGYTWSHNKGCGTDGDIKLPFDCTKQYEQASSVNATLISSQEQLEPYYEGWIDMNSADETREHIHQVANILEKDLLIELVCIAGSKIKIQGFSATGVIEPYLFQPEQLSCETPLRMKARWTAGFTLALLEQSERMTFRIREAPSNAAFIIGFSVGGVVLLSASGFGIYRYRLKKRLELQDRLGTGNQSLIQSN
ncbi:hypothetical protein FGO68_gene11501 [Halteria grandinella]|uniref:Uncharacterized protein n=1 Tax=Halteria grandinella TaxID=5974 RepID=A0A8J8NKC7_HALGN|nr:hypothetical protein FGO68_gene11501 [Halteria grandinella]